MLQGIVLARLVVTLTADRERRGESGRDTERKRETQQITLKRERHRERKCINPPGKQHQNKRFWSLIPQRNLLVLFWGTFLRRILRSSIGIIVLKIAQTMYWNHATVGSNATM